MVCLIIALMFYFPPDVTHAGWHIDPWHGEDQGMATGSGPDAGAGIHSVF